VAGIVWTGQVNFTDSSDVATTGVATLTLTPDIGVSNLPALVAGTSGLPPVLRNVTVNQVAAGTTPPASSWTLVTAGAAGTASTYDLTLYVNQGATGTSGSFTISTATDLVGVPASGYALVYNNSLAKWVISPMLAGDFYAPATYSSYSGNATQATIAVVTVPAQPFDWRPDVSGYFNATGTANTKVEIGCYLYNPITSNSDRVGYGPSFAAATPGPVTLVPAFGAAIGAGSYGRIPAGSAAQLTMVAKQVASGTTDAWAVSGSTASFAVRVNPIPAVYNRPITVTISGNPTGGSYTLTYGGSTTVAIAYNAGVAAMQSAVQSLASVGGAGNVTVTGYTGGPYVILLSSALSVSSNAITVASSSLTGGTTPAVVLS